MTERNAEPEVDLPSMHVSPEERAGVNASRAEDSVAPQIEGLRSPYRPPPSAGAGLLWAVCAALGLGVVGLGWWSHQQQMGLQQQLVATQNSFARVSEEASGRIEDITGKVTATETTLTEVERERERRLQKIEQGLQQFVERLAALESTSARLDQDAGERSAAIVRLQQQLQETATEHQSLTREVAGLQASSEQKLEAFGETLQQLQGAQHALREDMQQLAAVQQALQGLREQVQRQQQQIERRESEASAGAAAELVLLRAELDQRLQAAEEAQRAVDAFRVQTNRTLSAMQDQLRTLQARLP